MASLRSVYLSNSCWVAKRGCRFLDGMNALVDSGRRKSGSTSVGLFFLAGGSSKGLDLWSRANLASAASGIPPSRSSLAAGFCSSSSLVRSTGPVVRIGFCSVLSVTVSSLGSLEEAEALSSVEDVSLAAPGAGERGRTGA